MDKQSIVDLSRDMIEANRERDELFERVDNMVHLNYELPREVRHLAGVHKVTSTEPFDAVMAAVRVLSATGPLIKIQPLSGDRENIEQAETWEQVASWWFHNLNRRRGSTVLRDLVRSAVMYDEICVQTIYLPHQDRALRALRGEAGQRAMRKGPFAFNVYNPRNVYTMHGDTGIEGVLLRRQVPAWKVVKFWGDRAAGLRDKLNMLQEDVGSTDAFQTVTVYDYIDDKTRAVWVVPSEHNIYMSPASTDAVDIVAPMAHELPFIPWISMVGGSNLEEENTEHARMPMLYSVAQSDQWETLNVAETLVMSRALALAAKPAEQIEGPDPDSVETDYTDIGGRRIVPPGHSAQDLPPPQLDGGLLALADRVAQRVEASTVSRVLSGSAPASSSFSSLNLLTQTAVGAITPYKVLAEMALAEGVSQMFQWVAEVETEPIIAYGSNRELGQVLIYPDELPVEHLYVEVQLEPDVPTDRLQRANTAQLLNNLGYPSYRALEEAGVQDPKRAVREQMMEQLEQVELQNEIQRRQAQVQMEIEAAQRRQAFQLQMEEQQILQEQAAQQQAAAQQQQQGGFQGDPGLGVGVPAGPQPTFAPAGIPGIEGQGFNPAAGGLPPQLAAPGEGSSFEGQTFEDREGNPQGGLL